MTSLTYNAKNHGFKEIKKFINTYSNCERVLVILMEIRNDITIKYKIINYYKLEFEEAEDILKLFSSNPLGTHYFLNNFTNKQEKINFISEILDVINNNESIIP
jgi:hypothetical protein